MFDIVFKWIATWDWGTVADWLAAIGTVAAVAYALFSDKMRKKVNLKIYTKIHYANRQDIDMTDIDFFVKNLGLLNVNIQEILISNKKLNEEDLFYGIRSEDNRVIISLKFDDLRPMRSENKQKLIRISSKNSVVIRSRDYIEYNDMPSSIGEDLNKLLRKLHVYAVDDLNEIHRGKIKLCQDASYLTYEQQ